MDIFAKGKVRELSGVALKGLVSTGAPYVMKGMLCEMLHQEVRYKGRMHRINVKLVIEMVQENTSLWSLFPERSIAQIRRVAAEVGNIDWFTAQWLVDSMKEEHPALASLFLGWRKAFNWLGRQVEEAKIEAAQ